MEISKTKEIIFSFETFQRKAILAALSVLEGFEFIRLENQKFSEINTAQIALEALNKLSTKQLEFWISRLEQPKSLAVAV